MNSKLLLKLCLLGLIVPFFSSAQISGNKVYGDNGYRNNRYNSGSSYTDNKYIIVKDSIMQVTASIIMNSKPDFLLVTLGLSDEAKTVKEANAAINRRLTAFKKSLQAIGVTDNDTYVDFITQTKVLDYAVANDMATQFIKGFEIKKNITVKVNFSAGFDKVVELASENEIYDVIKVDYISNNTEKVFAEMMQAATNVVQQKKDVYLKASPVELSNTAPKIISENFFAVYPNSRYLKYEVEETADVNMQYYTNNSSRVLIKKHLRPTKTFYYDRIDQSKFDLVINNGSPVVGIQYVLEISMEFRLKGK